MKAIILFLLLTSCSYSQFVPFGAWKSGAAFSPADIDSLKGWYVATDIADSLGKSSGDTTYIWLNRARFLSPMPMDNIYQATDASKPVYMADSNVLVFDGVNDFLTTPNGPTYAQPSTIISVMKPAKSYVSNMGWFDGGTSTTRHLLYCFGLSNGLFAGANGPLSYKPYNADTTYISVVTVNGAASTVRINGVTGAAANSSTQAYKGLAIGAYYTGANASKASHYEFIVYHKVLTAGELAQIESYLATKYGITLP